MTDHAADMHRENMKKKRREIEQQSMDAASDLLDTDSNATFAMVCIVMINDNDSLSEVSSNLTTPFSLFSETIGSPPRRSISFG